MKKYERILFYDGDCGFCNSAVQFVLKRRKRDIYFVPLQSPMAHELLGEQNVEINLDTMYYWKKNMLFNRSSAAIAISQDLKGIYPLIGWLGKLIPICFRDKLYNYIATRRQKIRKGFCAIPKESEKYLFLQ